MQASKELELGFLDPLLESYKFGCEAALEPQEIEGRHAKKSKSNRNAEQNVR